MDLIQETICTGSGVEISPLEHCKTDLVYIVTKVCVVVAFVILIVCSRSGGRCVVVVHVVVAAVITQDIYKDISVFTRK